MWETVLLAVGE